MTCRSCGAEGNWLQRVYSGVEEPVCFACDSWLNDAAEKAILNSLSQKLELLRIEGEIQAQGGRSH